MSVAMCLIATAGCTGSNASQGAAEGATTGALAGAASGVVGALIFGGNVGDAAARGAVYGATAGAVVGGVSGSKRDQAEAAQQAQSEEAQVQKLKEEIGPDAFDGIVALVKCNYAVAAANARVAMKSKNSDHALGGLWVETLTYADQREEAKARALYPEIVSRDQKIKTEADAEASMRTALQELMDIRAEYDLPQVCPA
jgi:ribonucleotide reductase alpha subunit